MRSASSQIRLRQRSIFGRSGLFKQLRRAANSRQRILDLMGQHRSQRDHRARRASVRQLPVHLVGNAALLQHHDDMAGPLGDRRHVKVDLAVASHARRAEIDFVFIDRRTAGAHLIDQRQQGAPERHQVLQRMPLQELRGDFEKRFGRHVGVRDPAVGCDQQHGIGQRVEDDFRIGRHYQTMFSGGRHAAALQAKSSNASPSERWTYCGLSDVRICPRQLFNTVAGTRLHSAATSSAQPRCLRAWRRPMRNP